MLQCWRERAATDIAGAVSPISKITMATPYGSDLMFDVLRSRIASMEAAGPLW